MTHRYSLLAIAAFTLSLHGADEQSVTVKTISVESGNVTVSADLHGKPTELDCKMSSSSCSQPQPGQYNMRTATAEEAVYQDCTNVVLFRSSGAEKQKIGVYCWLNASDDYLVSSSKVGFETTPTLFRYNKLATSTTKHAIMRGHVIAHTASTSFGEGLGPKWMTFVFMAEGVAGKSFPFRIAYSYADQLPPDSFWDYVPLYELEVQRNPTCDTTVRAISYTKTTNEKGEELPPQRAMKFVKNAPSNLLKTETPLPCYILWQGHYKRVDSIGSH